MRRFAFLSALIVLPFVLTGCNTTEIESLGDKAFEAGKYKLALKAYQYCVKEKEKSGEDKIRAGLLYYKIGLCYENLQMYEKAVQTYKIVPKKIPDTAALKYQSIVIYSSKRINICMRKFVEGETGKKVSSSSAVPQKVAGTSVESLFAQIKALQYQRNRAIERGDLKTARKLWKELAKLEKAFSEMSAVGTRRTFKSSENLE